MITAITAKPIIFQNAFRLLPSTHSIVTRTDLELTIALAKAEALSGWQYESDFRKLI